MIPTAALPDRVTVEHYLGTTGAGTPAYGAPVSARSRKVGRVRTVRSANGNDTVSSYSFVFRPTVVVPPLSRITHGDDTYTVIDASDARQLHRGWALEVAVEGPR